ncbi:hypothetical protein [Williamsia deligens]|uniref:Uncharacterized protein n=1 Tax=Williamsia deligens TaxID=321325 RepID=A0ABW3G8U9_9NOCA|nr:hypothetical protein [Williamsia deligens]MCP2192521.1 hypothetical protein [Williamsia deligens]
MSQNDHDMNAIPTGDPMPQLVHKARSRPRDENAITESVRACIAVGYDWSDIGPAIGLSVNEARERWRHLQGDPRA